MFLQTQNERKPTRFFSAVSPCALQHLSKDLVAIEKGLSIVSRLNVLLARREQRVGLLQTVRVDETLSVRVRGVRLSGQKGIDQSVSDGNTLQRNDVGRVLLIRGNNGSGSRWHVLQHKTLQTT